MNPLKLLEKYFDFSAEALETVIVHSRHVATKALAISERLDITVDRDFIEEAALLHDIGICQVHAPKISCFGAAPYIVHGLIGREILEGEGLLRHALICERHIGVGLSRADVIAQNLPLPHRDMVPITLEERIVCMADLFFSKTPGRLDHEKSFADIEKSLARFGEMKVTIFRQWAAEFDCLPAGL